MIKQNLMYFLILTIFTSLGTVKAASLKAIQEGVHAENYEVMPYPQITSDMVRDINYIVEHKDELLAELEAKKAKEAKKKSASKALVSWYGKRFHGKLTASGKPYNMNALTAAHKKLPFGTKVKITNTQNNKSVIVTINDRGPYVGKREFDLSKAAFDKIASVHSGILNVTYEIL